MTRTADLGSTTIGGREFRWGERTFVMGIINATPDSFSGDGLLAAVGDWRPGAGDPTLVPGAVAQGKAMIAGGADVLDVGGESTRPGADHVDEAEERRRVVPIVEALHRALPGTPISVDTTKAAVAEAAIDRGAALINDVWGVADRTDLIA